MPATSTGSATIGPSVGPLAGASGSVSAAGFAAAVRRRMEGVALGLASGSYAQRVQAEFLKEVEERGEEVLSGKKKK